MLHQHNTYAETYETFAWDIPEYYNIGVDVCDRWAAQDPDRIAIIDARDDGTHRDLSYGALKSLSNRLANALSDRGIAHGPQADRVGILLPQAVETAATHIAVYKMGCIAIPLFTLFGEDALVHRLKDSGAKAIVTDATGYQKLTAIRDQLPELELILSVDGAMGDAECFHQACAAQSDMFTPVHTKAEDPALIIYTSGTTGNPKGALHAHRILLGHLPGVEMSHNFLPHDGDRFWTPADWAWIGGLLDVLLPSLHHGIPVVARRFAKFTPEEAFKLIKDHQIRNVFLPPTALKIMKTHPGAADMGITLRSLASGGETLGAELIDWCEQVFGCIPNEFYGQTECNMVVSSCSALEPVQPGIMGYPVPGHRVDIVNAQSGEILAPDCEGAIAIRSPDPVMFLHYWNNPTATRDKFVTGSAGTWLLTGDKGIKSPDGTIKFVGRDDDVIGSAGYRIGPSEIEDCLLRHPAVQMAGAVAWPDDIRGSVVAAYVQLSDGYAPSTALETDIAAFVKSHLAAHEYPRIVRFLDELPLTTTGKIIRAQLRELARIESQSSKTNAPSDTRNETST
jgi:acetyl-CoA synthetase